MSSTPGWAKEWDSIPHTQTSAHLSGPPYFPVLARLAFLVNLAGAVVCGPQPTAARRRENSAGQF